MTPPSPDLRTAHPLTAPLDSEAFWGGDPHPRLAELRATAPVAWTGRYWAVTSHAEVQSISRDPATWCSGRGILALEIGLEYPTPPTMMHTDPPDHTRYRRLVQPAFSPAATRGVEPFVREGAARLVDDVLARGAGGEAIDLVEHLAAPLPLEVIAHLLGIDDHDWPRFLRWSDAAIPDTDGFTPEDRMAAMGEMQAYLLEAARGRRGAAQAGEPGADVITTLANVEVDGDTLTDDELVMFLNQLLVAGNETSRTLLSGGLWALATHPEQWRRLVEQPDLVPAAVEEMLRWTTPVVAFLRTATRPTELRGVPVAAGDPALLIYAAANRDPEAFGPTAGSFDVGRDPNPHVAFGYGPHFCVGAALARLEARAVLDELLHRGVQALSPAGELETVPSSIVAGNRRAPVVFEQA